MSCPSTSGAVIERLNETIERAFRLCPYYREAFHGIDLTVRSIVDLRRFPLLSRETLLERGYDMLAAGCVPTTVAMSGGTSAAAGLGRPVLTFHGSDESRARAGVIDASYGQSMPRPLLLHLVNLGHGYHASSAVEGAFQMPIERPFHVEAILSILSRRFELVGFTPRVQAIVGGLRLLKALTLLCIERGVEGVDFDIQLLSSSSNQLTSRWRALLADYWGADVDETYGLSEIPGLHACRCGACGRFHFSPLAVAEVLELDGCDPVYSGIGRVVATGLFPLTATQPIIRYDTGDVVEIVDSCPAAHTFGFEFLGRQRDLVTFPGPEGPRALLTPLAVNEVLDGVPDVATEQFAFAKNLGLGTGVGFQRWGLRHTNAGKGLTLAIELRWSPTQFPAARLKQTLEERILAASPVLSDAIATGEISFSIELHEPDTTDLKALI